MSSGSLETTAYMRPPRVGVASGLSLSKMLLTRVPKKPGPGVIWAAKALATKIVATEAAWRAQGQGQTASARPADTRVDRAWAAVNSRLSDYELFPADDPDRIRAAELKARLFPTGLDFLQLAWVQEHAQSERRLQIIEEERMRPDLDRLIDAVFVTELHDAHEDYGVALGITEPREAAPKVSMVEPLRELVQAIGDYTLQVLAFARFQPGNEAAARRALAPIDMFREAAAQPRRRVEGEAEGGAAGGPEGEAAAVEEDYALPEGAPAPDAPIAAVPEA